VVTNAAGGALGSTTTPALGTPTGLITNMTGTCAACTANAATSATNLLGGGVGSAPYQSAANTTGLIASPTTTGHTFAYAWQPAGSAVAPTALDITANLANLANNTGVVGRYYYTEGTGTTLTDYSGNGNTATFTTGAPVGTWLSPVGLQTSIWTGSATQNPQTTDTPFTGNTVKAFQVTAARAINPTVNTYMPFNNQVEVGNSAATGDFFIFQTSSSEADVYGYAPNYYNQARLCGVYPGIHVFTFVFGSPMHVYIDGVESPCYGSGYQNNYAAPTVTKWQIGGSSSSTSEGFDGVTYGAVFYSAAPSAARVYQEAQYEINRLKGLGLNLTPVTSTANNPAFITSGDSLTSGNINSNGTWQSAVTLNNTPTIYNAGAPGQQCDNMDGIFGAGYTTDLSLRGTNVIQLWCGTNDIGAGKTPAVVGTLIQQDIAYFRSQARAAGVGDNTKILVATMMDRTGTSANLQTLDGIILANAVPVWGADGVVDIAASTVLGCSGCNTNTTYFQSADHTHPTAGACGTATGQGQLCTIIQNRYNALLGSTAQAPTIAALTTHTIAAGETYTINTPVAAATYTLPPCVGLTGVTYTYFDASATIATTIAPSGSDTIIGNTSIAAASFGKYTAQHLAGTAGGCYWISQ
jgi:hypothetical protein